MEISRPGAVKEVITLIKKSHEYCCNCFELLAETPGVDSVSKQEIGCSRQKLPRKLGSRRPLACSLTGKLWAVISAKGWQYSGH